MLSQVHHIHALQSPPVALLPRPDVDQLLINAFEKPLTTVVAGAGYGKTSAVSSAVESTGGKYAWLSLSELDNLSGILWRRLIHAVEIHHRELAGDLAVLGYPDSPAPFYQMLRMLEAALESVERFLLILDDFHNIVDRSVLHFFEKLIAAHVPKLSIVIMSRERPRLSLASMLSKGLMARITEDELRFSFDEMSAYYRMLGVTLDGAAAADLHARTEGWPIAICLVGLSLMRNPACEPTLALRVNVDIFMLIEEEIYGRASEDLQKFLIILSLLDAVPADLLRELADDMPGVLAEMAHSSQLIRHDPHLDCYRMNHLFQDFLLRKKALLTDAEIRRAHLTAGRWFRAHDQLEEALDHYRECDAYAEIFDVILSVRGRVAQDVANAFLELIDRTPKEIIESRPIIRVEKALYLINNNRIQEAHALLNAIRDEYMALEPTREHLAILGEAHVLLGLISIIRQNLEFVELFRKADECLPCGSVLIDRHYNIAEGINVVGIKDPVPGALKRYQDALFMAAPHATRAMNGCGFGMEYLNAADVALITGNLQDAERYAYEAIYHARQAGQHTIEYMANFYLIRAFVYKGSHEKISLLLRQMREELQQPPSADCITTFDIIEGWLFVKIGRTKQVAKWILHEKEIRKLLAPVVLGREYLVRSDWLLAEGRYHELLGFMKQSDIFYEERGILYAQIQNKITESIIHHYLGNHEQSMRALETAYRLSHPNDLVFQYIEYGSKMRTVMQAAMQDASCKIPRSWLESIHTKSSTYAKRLAQVIKDHNAECAPQHEPQIRLSKREQEVLSCLCHGFTRDEIADSCSLSPNTVRSILQSVFHKLGALNALDAVRIATMKHLA